MKTGLLSFIFLCMTGAMAIAVESAPSAAPAGAQANAATGANSALIERSAEGHSENKNAVLAKKEIQDQVIQKLSEDVIKEIIGEAKFSRNKGLIEQKVIRNSGRYIPYTRPGELIAVKDNDEEGYKMNVTMKISLNDLQGLLLENALFYESDSTPTVLPMIRWRDEVHNQKYSWWRESLDLGSPLLSQMNRNLENTLKSSFMKIQFYSAKPGVFHTAEILPSRMMAEHLSLEDVQSLAPLLGAQIRLDGEVVVQKSKERSEAFHVSIRLVAEQVQNGRVIAEVSRVFETDPGVFEAEVTRKMQEMIEPTASDLVSQVSEAWTRGTIGSSLYRLTLNGSLPIMVQEAFKEGMKNKVREIKNLRERMITADSVVFELESLISPEEVGKKAAQLDVANYSFELQSSNDHELVYRVSGKKGTP